MLAAQSRSTPKQKLLERLGDARAQTDRLFEIVRADSLYERPIAERHRIVFYIGHLEAFDFNLLRQCAVGLSPIYPEFDKLFAFGIDPVGTSGGTGLPSDRPSDWPALAVVQRYRNQLRDRIDDALKSCNDTLFTELNIAVEHRLMHAETLAYMFHQLPLSMKVDGRPDQAMEARAARTETIEIAGGPITMGLSSEDGEFGWDNEFERHSVDVSEFAIDRYKVTNGQYRKFVDAGGYDRRELWSDAGWEWIQQSGVRHPAFWKRGGDGAWLYRGMLHESPLPESWPVFVSHAEASAYAKWAGKKLPSESQWQSAAELMNRPHADRDNFDFRRWDPVPVNAVQSMTGNGWEWTSTPFTPFDGFRINPLYPGYSADFFDGKHFVMKGASMRTAECMARPTFRNWFQAHYPYVYAGFRCVED